MLFGQRLKVSYGVDERTVRPAMQLTPQLIDLFLRTLDRNLDAPILSVHHPP